MNVSDAAKTRIWLMPLAMPQSLIVAINRGRSSLREMGRDIESF